MSDDFTQQQTLGEQLEAERLSRQATTAPAEIPGYRVERFLGAGAFGQVWVGRDLNTGRPVAIKFYLHRSGVNWSLLQREVKNLVALSADRHIVQVLEVGWDSDPPYYVMEYLQYGSLEDLLRKRGSMPVEKAVSILRDICIGLNHSHGKGILHCDLKPANILLDDGFRPRIADFGQSRMSNEQTPALGTLFYMAPEQADLDAIPDARWDVYGLGAILFRMLTGKAPYRNPALLDEIDTAGSLPKRLERYRQAIMQIGPVTEHHRMKGIDRRLANIVDTCLEADPEKRFANVQQVLLALNRRETLRNRKPLALVGVVGPLVLLAATCLFAVRSILETRSQTTTALKREAISTNGLAARFAAAKLETDLRNYFDTIRDEADEEELRELAQETLNHPLVEEALQDIARDDEPTEARSRLLDSPVIRALNIQLATRLASYQKPVTRGVTRPVLATMFLTDPYGTIFSIAYDQEISTEYTSLGRNFAHRTYYHGGPEDFDPRTLDRSEVQPLRKTHLSAPFRSSATGLWKIAVSTPIWFDEEADQAAEPPDALLVGTINLGDFQLLSDENETIGDLAAVLIDARLGRSRGTVLQHPLMDARAEAGLTLAKEVYQVPTDVLDELAVDGSTKYHDPVSAAPDGAPYAGDWIAAAQRIVLPSDSTEAEMGPPKPSDLMVLVQYRMTDVLSPVGRLVERLLREMALTISAIILVMFGLWFLVLRNSQSTRESLIDDYIADDSVSEDEPRETLLIR